jgi:hypothetical protein
LYKSKKIIAALIALLILLPGCGYTLSKAGSNSSVAERGLYKVSVPTFVNDTYEPLIEREVTSALKDEIASDGRLVLTDGDDADMTVAGRVTSFDLQPLSYDASERILEYRVKIKTEVKLTEIKTGKVLWKDSDMETASDYRVIDDITKSKIRKGEAIRKASKEMAEDFIIKALDIF